MKDDQGFSRRDFLKFSALGAAGAAAAGAVGCAPATPSSAPTKAVAGPIDSADAVLKLSGGMPKWSFMIPPDPIAEDKIEETIENDIIVVGGGMSGFTTAV